MGIYKNVNPVYGKNEKNERFYKGLNVDGTFYPGIRKTSEIPKPVQLKTPSAKTVQPSKKKSIFSKV